MGKQVQKSPKSTKKFISAENLSKKSNSNGLEGHKVLKLAAQLERWYVFRRTDWATELEYPEFTTKEVNRFLAY